MRALIKVTLHQNRNGEGRPDRRQQQNKSRKRYIQILSIDLAKFNSAL